MRRPDDLALFGASRQFVGDLPGAFAGRGDAGEVDETDRQPRHFVDEHTRQAPEGGADRPCRRGSTPACTACWASQVTTHSAARLRSASSASRASAAIWSRRAGFSLGADRSDKNSSTSGVLQLPSGLPPAAAGPRSSRHCTVSTQWPAVANRSSSAAFNDVSPAIRVMTARLRQFCQNRLYPRRGATPEQDAGPGRRNHDPRRRSSGNLPPRVRHATPRPSAAAIRCRPMKRSGHHPAACPKTTSQKAFGSGSVATNRPARDKEIAQNGKRRGVELQTGAGIYRQDDIKSRLAQRICPIPRGPGLRVSADERICHRREPIDLLGSALVAR